MSQTIAGGNETFLVIPDLQIPFEHEKALDFCAYLKRHYRISDDHCLNVGDETDQYFASMYKKNPNARHTPTSELNDSIATLKRWYSVFPKMKVAISNHGVRWWKRAQECDIPEQLLRTYRDVIEAPQGWRWEREWRFNTRHPFRMIHGMGYSGQNGHRTAAIDAGISTVHGHLHSHAGIAVIKTTGLDIWGMNVGCLIDVPAYAFEYGQDSRFKPCLGAGIIANGGRTPIWIPYE